MDRRILKFYWVITNDITFIKSDMVPQFPTKNTFGLPNSNNRKQKEEERLYWVRMRFCFISKNLDFLLNFFCVEMQLKVWTENGEFMFNYINWKNYLFNQTLPPWMQSCFAADSS